MEWLNSLIIKHYWKQIDVYDLVEIIDIDMSTKITITYQYKVAKHFFDWIQHVIPHNLLNELQQLKNISVYDFENKNINVILKNNYIYCHILIDFNNDIHCEITHMHVKYKQIYIPSFVVSTLRQKIIQTVHLEIEYSQSDPIPKIEFDNIISDYD
jgi:hypothetical protein